MDKTNNSRLMKYLWIASIIIVGVVCFFIGRKSSEVVTHTIFVKEKPISGNILAPQPIQEKEELDPILPYKIVDFKGEKLQIIDSAKVFNEYTKRKMYDLTLFDNQFGKLDIKPSLQYNEIVEMPYTFTPITRVDIVIPKWEFFVGTSINTFEIVGFGGGAFYKNVGIEYKYLHQLRTGFSGHEVAIKYKL